MFFSLGESPGMGKMSYLFFSLFAEQQFQDEASRGFGVCTRTECAGLARPAVG